MLIRIEEREVRVNEDRGRRSEVNMSNTKGRRSEVNEASMRGRRCGGLMWIGGELVANIGG